MGKKFQIHRGAGGLAGQAARLQRAASGQNNEAIQEWMRSRAYVGGDEGAGGNGGYLMADGGGDSFEKYDAPQSPTITQSLNAGNAFNGPWVDKINFLGMQAVESFESYTNFTGANGGFGFTVGWTERENFTGVTANENFETYTDGANVVGSNAGTGWSGAWDV